MAQTYQVHANKSGWRFATMEEARRAANDVFQRRGIVVAITASDKAPTHAWKGAAA